MDRVSPVNPNLEGFEPYDPKYLPAEVLISANENTSEVPPQVAEQIARRLGELKLNRYPDPTASRLRDLIAEAHGVKRANVVVGDGGDELLMNLMLTWGGQGRTFLNLPPTFSAYELYATIAGAKAVNVPRRADFTIDEEAVLARLAQGGIDFAIITSPNNPTGDTASYDFIERVLNATDALVLVDEAYGEFSSTTALPLLREHANLAILHTFSKAYSLAGARVGYLLSSPQVIDQFLAVRLPYSVNAMSQVAAEVAMENRELFEPCIARIVSERGRLAAELAARDGVEVFPSEANYLFMRLAGAHEVWERLYQEHSVLVRDFSGGAATKDCLRVSIGSPEENDRFLAALDAVRGGR